MRKNSHLSRQDETRDGAGWAQRDGDVWVSQQDLAVFRRQRHWDGDGI